MIDSREETSAAPGVAPGSRPTHGFLRPACAVPGVHIVLTLRNGPGVSAAPFDAFNLGAHCGDAPEAVTANRTRLVQALALPEAPRWLHQVHGTEVAMEPGYDAPSADAAVTRYPRRVLAVLSADCLPVALYSHDGGVLALAHAGWRGLAAGVIESTLTAMAVPAAQLCAWLGPAAGPQHYEVDAAVRSAFVQHDAAAAQAFVPTRPGHWLCDLYALARLRLMAVGVDNIAGGELCTISDPLRFFSHRRDARSGRMATLLWRD